MPSRHPDNGVEALTAWTPNQIKSPIGLIISHPPAEGRGLYTNSPMPECQCPVQLINYVTMFSESHTMFLKYSPSRSKTDKLQDIGEDGHQLLLLIKAS